MFGFNLIEERWLPCLMNTGELLDLSLRETLTDAPNIAELIGDSPPVTIALHRLLLAILHRALRAPQSLEHWGEIWRAQRFDQVKLEDYLNGQKTRFDLFDATRPFYQSATARVNVQSGAVIQLYFQGKNNATLFDHSTLAQPNAVSPATAARLLIAFQAFDFGGIKADGSAQTAPLLGSAVALVKGANLLQTLLLNFHHYSHQDGEPFPFSAANDLPAWEREPKTEAVERLPDGYVDLLTWQSRRIFLQPEQNQNGETIIKNTVIMRGNSFPKTVARNKKETMIAYRAPKDKTGDFYPLGFSETRALWRNSRALFQTVDGEQTRPRTLDWLGDLIGEGYLDRADGLPIEFYGIAADKAKLLFWQKESFYLPLAYLDDDKLFVRLGQAIQFAEDIALNLKSGVKKLAELLQTEAANFAATAIYWSTLELEFQQLLSGLPKRRDQAMREWFEVVDKTASGAFETTANSLSGAAAEQKAVVAARDEFRKWRNVLLAKNSEYRNYLPRTKVASGEETQ